MGRSNLWSSTCVMRPSKTTKYRICKEGNMTVEFAEFYYLIAACVIYLGALIAFNAVGGGKKKKSKN